MRKKGKMTSLVAKTSIYPIKLTFPRLVLVDLCLRKAKSGGETDGSKNNKSLLAFPTSHNSSHKNTLILWL